MSNPSINFKVGDEGVSSYMDKLKQKSDAMTAQFIRDAQIQTNTAKEQLRLLEEKIRATQRLAVLQKQISEATVRDSTAQRIGGIESRGNVIDTLFEHNKLARRNLKESYTSGTITREEYDDSAAILRVRNRRIENLAGSNTEESIRKQGEIKLKETREAERNNQILASYMRENINTIRQASQHQVSELRKGNQDITDTIEDSATPQEKLVKQLTNQQISQERKSEKSDDWKDKARGMLGFANALAVDRVGGMVAGMPGANNELDYIKPMMSSMGLLLGGLPGIIADMATGTTILGFSLGQSTFGQLGMQVGSKMGEFAGESASRTYKGRDALQTANFKLKAMGYGGNIERFGASYQSEGDNSSYQLGGTGMFSDMDQAKYSAYGMDMGSVSKLQSEIASRRGYVSGISGVTDSMMAVRGVGVQDQTSLTLLELLRSNVKSDRDLSSIIGGVLGHGSGIFKDGDRAFLNEFLIKNYTQLHKTLLSSSNTVNSGMTMDILSKFNSVGGPFSARDPRSMGLISGIQSSLSNPGSDSMKALMFTLMRQGNPDMELGDMQIEMQKGLGSPKQFQSIMKYLVSQGGSKSYQMNQVASAFGLQGNLGAAKKLLEGYQKFGDGFDPSMLDGTGAYSEGSMAELSKSQVSPFTVSSAEIENEFIKSSVSGIQMVGTKMKGLMGDMLDGLSEYIKAEIKKIGNGQTRENPTQFGKIPGQGATRSYKSPATIYPSENR